MPIILPYFLHYPWFEFILQHRSLIIWIVSFAVGGVVFWMIKSIIGKRESGGVPKLVFPELFTLGGGGGQADIVKTLLTAMAAIAKSRWALGILVAAILGIVGGYVFLYVADAGTKKLIETQMTFPAPLCKRTARDSVILFIHGWGGEANETWEQFPKLACDDPRLSKTDIISVGYPTYMRQSGYTVVETAMWIYRELLERAALQETDKVVVVAHSMGGLIAREIALKAPTSKVQLHILGIVTISSPHNGTDIGAIADALGVSTHYTADMKHGSSMLASLQVRWNDTDAKYRPRLVCLGGVSDRVVATDSAFFQCDEQYKIQQWGHSELVKPTSRDDERYRLPMSLVVKALQQLQSDATGTEESERGGKLLGSGFALTH